MIDLKPTIDEDKYPTDETERLIREFRGDAKELLAAIKEVWAYKSWGWNEADQPDEMFPEKQVHRYHISTGGWSGNESLIGALVENRIFWMIHWVQSRRGGHYIFEVRNA